MSMTRSSAANAGVRPKETKAKTTVKNKVTRLYFEVNVPEPWLCIAPILNLPGHFFMSIYGKYLVASQRFLAKPLRRILPFATVIFT
jgi:hypothetical protein